MFETKFKVWDKKHELMFYQEYDDEHISLVDFKCYEIYENKCGIYKGELPYILLQYTGLIDRNDKEIFVGDVCAVWIGGIKQDSNYIVEDLRELYLEMNRDDSYYRFSKIEVIGNIYENPWLDDRNKNEK